jgi:hypothetical protein
MMEKERIILLVIFFACLSNAAWADLVLNNSISNDPMGDIMNRINNVACIFLTIMTYTVSGLSAVIIIYAGVKYMTSQDAEQTTNAKNMIIYAIAGLALVLLACPIVDYFVIGTKIVPFREKCNCFGGLTGSSSNPPGPPALTCNGGTPPGQCSTTTGYSGYRCRLSANQAVLVLDPSCSGTPPVPPVSTTTTTTTTTQATTTTTTMADHGICFNAERDGLCSGLNVLRTGLQADCCNEWGCCCSPATGTCTSP